MGLPGAGKTTFTKKLVGACPFHIDAYNADVVRNFYGDWDFSDEGRLRQAERMALFAKLCVNELGYNCVCDFVCPTEHLRQVFNADITVWIDTIKEGRFENTNKLFETPSKYDYRITDFNQEDNVINELIKLLKGDNYGPVISTKK